MVEPSQHHSHDHNENEVAGARTRTKLRHQLVDELVQAK